MMKNNSEYTFNLSILKPTKLEFFGLIRKLLIYFII